MSGRKVELDEVTVPTPLLESSSSQKSVPVIPTPISEEANDIDHETSDQVSTEPRRSTKVHTLFSYMDVISDFMASNHFVESGLIIASS